MQEIYLDYFKKNNWILSSEKKTVRKSFKFIDFPSAIAWMVEASFYAEKINHHPEWKNVYNNVYVELTTHDINGLSDKDGKIASFMDNTFSNYVKK